MLGLVDIPRGGLLLHRDERRGLPIVHLPVPELVAEAIEMGDSQPMKGQPNEIRGAPRTAPRRRVTRVHHVVQRWNGGHVCGGLWGDEPRAGDTDPLSGQTALPHPPLWGNPVQGAPFVVWSPS